MNFNQIMILYFISSNSIFKILNLIIHYFIVIKVIISLKIIQGSTIYFANFNCLIMYYL